MVSAVRPLGALSMARGCARIDSRLDAAKIGSDGRVEVHRARLRAEKRFHTAWTQSGHWVRALAVGQVSAYR
jgi:hypothetical protein